MTLEQRKAAFKSLGHFCKFPDSDFTRLIHTAHHSNAWFTPDETAKALNGLAEMLNEQDLDFWFSDVSEREPLKRIGLVLAGNLPMVGFHDILAVLATGNLALIKASSQDKLLIPYLLNHLVSVEPAFTERIIFTERLQDFDAVIATGSNNTARYFEYYFGKVPNIIRKNRNSIAVLSGGETPEQLALLGRDIFDYFGLGCRNVSKLYVPENYDFHAFFQPLESYSQVVNHNKYCNNYEYNKSIYLINGEKHLDNGFLLLKEDSGLASPLAVLFYERYQSLSGLAHQIATMSEQIQCIVTEMDLDVPTQGVSFGKSQQPKLWDYADGINTLEFLSSL